MRVCSSNVKPKDQEDGAVPSSATKDKVMSKNKQSSVQWVINELTSIHSLWILGEIGATRFDELYTEIIQNAEAMHKEECIDLLNTHNDIFETSEDHYNATFGGNNE